MSSALRVYVFQKPVERARVLKKNKTLKNEKDKIKASFPLVFAWTICPVTKHSKSSSFSTCNKFESKKEPLAWKTGLKGQLCWSVLACGYFTTSYYRYYILLYYYVVVKTNATRHHRTSTAYIFELGCYPRHAQFPLFFDSIISPLMHN